jgi:hypothetical protein
MSDLDDDSDSSDIGIMFEAAKRKNRQVAVQEKDDSEEDEDSDEESEDDAFWEKGGRKKQKQMSVEARLSMMEQQKTIRERQRAAKDADSDDSDEEEEGLTEKVGGAAVRRVDKNAVKIQVEVRQMGEENSNQNVLSPDSDDSSVEEVPASRSRRGPVSVDILKQQGVSQEAIDEICKSRQALEELKRAQNYDARDVRMEPAALEAALGMRQQQQLHHLQQQQPYGYGYGNGSGVGMPNAGAGINGNMQLAAALLQQQQQNFGGGYAGGLYSVAQQQQAQQQNLGQFLKVTVRARLERIGCEATFQDTSVSVRENESLQVFMDRFMTTMNLTPNNSVMTMQFNGHALTAQRTPAFYGMTNGSTVDAMVLLTGLMDFQARSGTAGTGTAPVAANLGKSIQLTLRHQSGKAVSEDVLSIRMKETFQALADKYRSSKSLGPSTRIVFKFDGETMGMTRTPESYDMEDEDLVDVIVQ